MTYFTQLYKSLDLNSPPLSGQVGSTPVLLNACLVDGYSGSVSITGITKSSNVATATVSSADGLKLKTGHVLTISGVTGGDASLYNGTFTITVASTTTFTYTMAGTPSANAPAGTFAGSLKLPITSITRGGTGNLTAFLTMSVNNTTLTTGTYVTIEGCSSTGAAQYNGTFKITVTGANTFTYQMVSDPGADATVTGASYYKAGLQWSRPFSAGTNSQTYLSQATVGAFGESYTPRYLQIIDNAATAGLGKECQLYGAELMTADQVDTNRFPTSSQLANGLCFRKSTTADSTQRTWTVVGDEKTFSVYNWTADISNNVFCGFGFGYFISTKAGDAYNTFVAGHSVFNSNTGGHGFFSMGWLVNSAGTGGFYIARSFTQAGGPIASGLSGAATGSTAIVISGTGQNFITLPNSSDNGYYVQPLFIQDGTGTLRGRLPGHYGSLQQSSLGHYDTLTNIVGLPDITLTAINISSSNSPGLMLVDTFGPWT